MAKTAWKGGAGGALGAAGRAGEVRGKILAKNLKPGDEIFIANPDRRDVREKEKALEKYIEKGGLPSSERLLSVGHHKIKVLKKHKDGSYTVEIPQKSAKALKQLFPGKKVPKTRAVRKRRIHGKDLKGDIVLRDGTRYKVK